MVGQQVAAGISRASPRSPGRVDVYTTLDLNMQRAALDAVRSGLDARRRVARATQAASSRRRPRCIAVDPSTGEILAMVGGRSYNQSQFNRAARRATPAGIRVQALRLPRRLRARRRRRPHRLHAGVAHRGRTERLRRSTASSGSRRTTTTTTARSPGAARWRCRATSARFMWASGRLRPGGRALAARRRRHASAGVSVDRAGRVRAHAVRSRAGVHAVPERRLGPAAQGDRSHPVRRARRSEPKPPPPKRSPAPTRRSWSRT